MVMTVSKIKAIHPLFAFWGIYIGFEISVFDELHFQEVYRALYVLETGGQWYLGHVWKEHI
jgi:hypothetical protein